MLRRAPQHRGTLSSLLSWEVQLRWHYDHHQDKIIVLIWTWLSYCVSKTLTELKSTCAIYTTYSYWFNEFCPKSLILKSIGTSHILSTSSSATQTVVINLSAINLNARLWYDMLLEYYDWEQYILLDSTCRRRWQISELPGQILIFVSLQTPSSFDLHTGYIPWPIF